MKPWKWLRQNKFIKAFGAKALNQRGQTIVEFVLLLFVITGLSYGFVAVMNKNLARYWQYSANLVVDDKPGTKTVKLSP